jgi:hypothetical protein
MSGTHLILRGHHGGNLLGQAGLGDVQDSAHSASSRGSAAIDYSAHQLQVQVRGRVTYAYR